MATVVFQPPETVVDFAEVVADYHKCGWKQHKRAATLGKLFQTKTSVRADSYPSSWNIRNGKPNSVRMAEAGQGYRDGSTQCVWCWCNIVLTDWDPTRPLAGQHDAKSPNCPTTNDGDSPMTIIKTVVEWHTFAGTVEVTRLYPFCTETQFDQPGSL